MSDANKWGLLGDEVEDATIIDSTNFKDDTVVDGRDASSYSEMNTAYNSQSVFENSFSYQEVKAGIELAQGRPLTYVPRASEQKVSEHRNMAVLRQAELGLGLDAGLSPTPHGTSSPTLGPSSDSADDFVTNPNVHPVHGIIPGGMNQVILKANSMDAYITTGMINDKQVTFLVDTGATDVSIPQRIANYIGLRPDGPAVNASTAGGTIRIQKTLIDELIIGNILLTHVSASINPRDRSDKILLGMSALKRLEFTHMDGKLILRQKPFA